MSMLTCNVIVLLLAAWPERGGSLKPHRINYANGRGEMAISSSGQVGFLKKHGEMAISFAGQVSFLQLALPCPERFGKEVLPELQASRERCSRKDQPFNVSTIVRNAEGKVTMAVFGLQVERGASGSNGQCSFDGNGKFVETLDRVMPFVKEWRDQCRDVQSEGKTLLMLREAGQGTEPVFGNVWHSLAAIFPIFVTMEELGLSKDMVKLLWPGNLPLAPAERLEHLKVLSDEQPLLYKDFRERQCQFKSLVVPLGDGFLWDLAWDTDFHCSPRDGQLVQDFTHHMLEAVKAQVAPPRPKNIAATVCIMHRESGNHRVLTNEQDILRALSNCKQHSSPVAVTLLEFDNSIPFHTQIERIEACDVLLGAHGGGMTHLLWLKPSAVIVEVIPSQGNTGSGYRYFQNLALITGHFYISIRGTSTEPDWRNPLYFQPRLEDVTTALEGALQVAGKSLSGASCKAQSSLLQLCQACQARNYSWLGNQGAFLQADDVSAFARFRATSSRFQNLCKKTSTESA